MNGTSNNTFKFNDIDDELEALILRFKNSSNTSDLFSLNKSIDKIIESIDFQLDQLVSINQKSLFQDITNIELLRSSKLSPPISNANQLEQIFHHANDLGYNLTYKIKSLDSEINNVNETLKFVENIQLLKNNINQANYAIESKNWTLAANCINTIETKLNQENLINGKFASIVIPSTDIPELPQVAIEKWTNQLTTVFVDNFNDAAQRRNVEQLTKFFQLFPLIKQEIVGLNCYSKFICEIINETSKNLISTLTYKGDEGDDEYKIGIFSTITMQLFENISMMLSQHGPLIKRSYSQTYPEALTYVISKIQKEVDLQIGIIADTFYDSRRLDKCFQDIQMSDFTLLNSRLNDTDNEIENVQYEELLSIRTVGDILSELSAIFQNWSLYCKFITMRYFKQQNSDEILLPELIIKSNFTRKINEKLLPSFEVLYQYYLRKSLEKSISIEELPSLNSYLLIGPQSSQPDQAPVSSVIEDVTLILSNTLKNTIQSGIPSTVKLFLNESFKIIQQDLINGFFIKNLNDNQPRYNQQLSLITDSNISQDPSSAIRSPPLNSRSGTPDPNGFFKGASNALGSVVGGALQSANSNNPKLLNFIIYFNSIATGQEYFAKIVDNLKKNNYLVDNFPFGKDSMKIENALTDEFLNPFVNITNKIIQESLINLYNQSIKQKLISLVNEFLNESNNENYIIYQQSSINDSSVLMTFNSNWKSLIQSYYQTLHKSLLTKLMRLVIINLSNLLEKRLLNVLKKFKINELGSIKLEKDLSFLINEVCLNNFHLREKFIRITQIVLLVGMDDEEYEESKNLKMTINEVKGEEIEEDEEESYSINWILTPQERDQIRKYRI